MHSRRLIAVVVALLMATSFAHPARAVDPADIASWATSMSGASSTDAGETPGNSGSTQGGADDSTEPNPEPQPTDSVGDSTEPKPKDALGHLPAQIANAESLARGALESSLSGELPEQVQALAVVVLYVHQGAGSANSASVGGCPNPTTCNTFKLDRMRWASADGRVTIPFHVNEASRPAGAPSISSAIGAATGQWERFNPSVRFTGGGATSARPGASGANGCADGTNTIGWRSLGGGAAGVAYVCYDRRSKQIFDADLALNNRLDWANFSSENLESEAFDIRAILTHELGHWVSLKDLSAGRTSSLTMHARVGPGEISKRTLGLGDVLGLRASYPCACAAVSGLASD